MNSDSVASGATAAQPSAPGGVPAVVAGIDVGKSWLDAHLEPGGLGRRTLCKWLRKHGASRAVFEPTGRYHRRLHQCLAAAGVETVAVRPDCARRFAEALGLLVKTDRVDAKVLARYGRLEGLEATAPLDPALAQLQDLVRVRRRFVDECASLGRQEQELESKAAVRHVRLQRRALERRVKALDKDLLEAIEADDGLRRRAEVLRSIPGIGALTAATLLADMPELGTLGRRGLGRRRPLRPRQRFQRGPPPRPRRPRPTALRAVHGRPRRDPLQPASGRLLQTPPRPRQAAQAGPRRRHAQTRRPRRRPPPCEPPLVALRALCTGARMNPQHF